jgi:hypothetical protein
VAVLGTAPARADILVGVAAPLLICQDYT